MFHSISQNTSICTYERILMSASRDKTAFNRQTLLNMTNTFKASHMLTFPICDTRCKLLVTDKPLPISCNRDFMQPSRPIYSVG